MKFSVRQNILAEMLNIAVKVAGKTNISPIAQCVRLDSSEAGISVSAMDFDNWVQTTTPGFREGAHQQIITAIMPCKQLHSIVSAMPKDEEIHFSIEKGRVTVKTASSKYTFGLMNKEEWPTPSEGASPKAVRINPNNLIVGLKFCLPSSGRDTGKYYCNGVNLSRSECGNLRFIGMDGGTQASFAIASANAPVNIKSVIIPRETIGLIIDIASRSPSEEEVNLNITESNFRMETRGKMDIFLTGKLIDGEFPDIDRVIPYARENIGISVPREPLLAALARMHIISFTEKGGRDSGVDFTFDHGIAKIAARKGTNEAEELLSLATIGKGRVVISSEKITAILAAFTGETVTFMLDKQNPESPATPVILVDEFQELSTTTARFGVVMQLLGAR